MKTTKSETRRLAEFVAKAEAMYVRLRAWRTVHPQVLADTLERHAAARQAARARGDGAAGRETPAGPEPLSRKKTPVYGPEDEA